MNKPARTISPAPVRRSIHVAAAPSKAFEVFTAGMGRWWAKTHTIGKSPQTTVVMEPRAGGRWYEIGEDGSHCEWGKVLAWEPPSRVLLAWQITSQWTYDADFMTEVEVRFIADAGGTRVELEHRNLERYGEKAEETRAALDSPGGWAGLLESFAKTAA
jgi:uncharacterized protein YndB with AHSA1/START domain